MEVFLYNSTVCRLCGEENDNGTFLYSCDENNQNTSDVVNAYLPLRVCDDGELPRTICPGCTIQLEATVEFINLIINGQKIIRALHQREIEYKKTVFNANNQDSGNLISEVDVENGAYTPEHAASLQAAGLSRPKRKRGRPPKKHKTPEELAAEAAAKEQELQRAQQERQEEEATGKRKRKTPNRFKEVVQGKELEKIFIEEGVTDGEESEPEAKPDVQALKADVTPKEPEVIGHTESGELVVVVKGKGRGRPKGRLTQKRHKCSICSLEFSCTGRYMSHVAAHGPVQYQCTQCNQTFSTRLDFTRHQETSSHRGQRVRPTHKLKQSEDDPIMDTTIESTNGPAPSLPVLNPEPEAEVDELIQAPGEKTEAEVDNNVKDEAKPDVSNEEASTAAEVETTPGKVKLTCPHCDKLFSSKQSRSMHIKAVHKGERPYVCKICGAMFAYPRALAMHSLKHRARASKGYACDLCGKVLNHPSSVTYHKEAEHLNQKFVCNKCGKSFKHKQLLQRHQLVHTQHRPYSCKQCSAAFKTKANLFNHQLLHSGIKKFACDLCKQRFAHKTSLTLHMRWHTGQKPYVCKVCGKAFSQKGNLSEHSRIHTGEKPFQCAHCPRSFTTSSQHRLHLRRHNNADDKPMMRASRARVPPPPPPVPAGPPPDPPTPHTVCGGVYKCGWCARPCSSRWALAKHARRHTGERPFKCPHCPRAFADCSNLNKHKKHVHKQISLLANPAPRPILPTLTIVPAPAQSPQRSELVVETSHDGVEERVIYVTYDVDDPNSPDYQLVDPEQAAELIEQAEASELYSETLLRDKLTSEPITEHMSVTDEQGNPLHFTMQDGTQLAITSIDGQSLQVITEDGQTIPVEINGYTPGDIQMSPSSSVQLSVQKSDEEPSSPITHYYTIV